VRVFLFGVVVAGCVVIMTACALAPAQPATPREAVKTWAAEYDTSAETVAVEVKGAPVALDDGRICLRASLSRTWSNHQGENAMSSWSFQPFDLVYDSGSITSAEESHVRLPNCKGTK
jgi:hypothetical protein